MNYKKTTKIENYNSQLLEQLKDYDSIKEQLNALSLKVQFLALGLIEISIDKINNELIKLTPKGITEMKRLNTIKC